MRDDCDAAEGLFVATIDAQRLTGVAADWHRRDAGLGYSRTGRVEKDTRRTKSRFQLASVASAQAGLLAREIDLDVIEYGA